MVIYDTLTNPSVPLATLRLESPHLKTAKPPPVGLSNAPSVSADSRGDRPTVAIETHGCKLNQADSMRLSHQFQVAGYRMASPDEPVDVYVLNTCTVTHVADAKARRALRALRRRHPEATIVATGCYAERVPEDLRDMEDVDLVIGNTGKGDIVRQVMEWRDDTPVPCAVGDDEAPFSPRIARTRAMVKIQEGCNQVCAYCIVPRVRGRERSIPPDEIVAEINMHAALGYQEVVLTGTQLGSYGFDIPGMSLTRLLERVLSGTGVPRLRVSSLQPQDLSPGLLTLWSDRRWCPHFHMPLQSGSDPVLTRMRRRYTAGQYADAVERVRESVGDVSITADVLVGFPGETGSEFQATYALCEQVGFAGMHVFPYSVRPGTSAAHFDGQVPSETKARRVKTLMELGDAHAARFRARSIGDVRPVLWEEARESDGATTWSGLTDNYIRVAARSHERLASTIRPARLVSAGNGAVMAEVL